MELAGFGVEEAVSERATERAGERGRTSGRRTFVGEAMGIVLALGLRSSVGFELAQVVAEVGEGVLVGGELERREEGFMDLPRAPCYELGTTVEENFHPAGHGGVVDLNAGDFAVAGREEPEAGTAEIDVDIESWGFEGGESIGNGRS